ncbi:MAG: PEP-CTERM sorting domain-containing protein [Burkholderiaceae bacterium]|nr:PEP-CTERM sorting domain-containing protein [Burkholderiaceae bacterium]
MKTGKFPAKSGWPSLAAMICLAFGALSSQQACATTLPLGDAGNYAVLFDGLGANSLNVTNVVVNGNIGVAGTGKVAFSGPGKMNGSLSFSAANTSQYSNTNPSNVGPTSVTYGKTSVQTDMNTLNTLSSTLGGAAGSAVNLINGNQTINESSGTLYKSGGVTYRVFTVGSVNDQAGQTLTINGDGSGDPIVFNFTSSANLQGDVTLTGGLVADDVLWNFTGGSGGTGGPTASLNNNASSYSALAWYGDILDPNGAISVVNANLDGRVFGGGSNNMQIVSGDTITVPFSHTIPEPSTLALVCVALFGLSCQRKTSRI